MFRPPISLNLFGCWKPTLPENWVGLSRMNPAENLCKAFPPWVKMSWVPRPGAARVGLRNVRITVITNRLNFLQMGEVVLQHFALQAKASEFSLTGNFD